MRAPYFSVRSVFDRTRFCWSLAAWLLFSANVALAQLVAYYPFDDGTSNDASGHGLNGTVSGGAVFTSSGHSGGAYAFNGATSYIQIDNLNINPSAYPTLTMGAWVLANDVSPIRQIISQDDGGFDRSLGLDNRGGVTGWSTFVGSGVLGGQAASTGVWTFVAVAYDQPAGTAMLYIDGSTYTGAATNGTGWNFTRIGVNPSFVEYFNGTIDDVFFFSSALTAAQLDNIRLNGVLAAVPEPGSAAAWCGLAVTLFVLVQRRQRRQRARVQLSR